jgi:hypothetical protein
MLKVLLPPGFSGDPSPALNIRLLFPCPALTATLFKFARFGPFNANSPAWPTLSRGSLELESILLAKRLTG